MDEKNKHLLAYILKHHPNLPVTSLMKISYLIDLVSVKKTGNQISHFTYIRYKYGPFDNSIYGVLTKLVNDNIIKEDVNFTPAGDEYIIYRFNEDCEELLFDQLSESEKETIDEVVNSIHGVGARVLVELAYRTKPMKEIGATIGGNEGLNTVLDLRVV